MSSDSNILSGLPPLDGYGSDAPGATNAHARGSARPWPPVPPTPPTSASQTHTPYSGQAVLGQATSQRALRSASNDDSSAMTGGTAMVRMNGRTSGEDAHASSNAGGYVPGGGTGGLTSTANQHAVTQDTSSWAAISSMMERPENVRATHVMPAISPDGDGEDDPEIPAIDDLLNDGSLIDACRNEYDRVARDLDELRLLVKQSGKELEKLNHRKVLTAATVREIEEHMELHSRQEIRAAYLAASEAEMRAFMISEQREQMETKLSVYERYSAFLSATIATLSQLPQPGATPFDEANLAPWNLPTGGPAPSITGAPAWYADMAASQAALAPLGASGPTPGHDLASITRVIEAQESVRQRVAQRLHDGPTQSLANVVLAAEICEKLVQSEPRRALGELSNLKGLVNTTLQETRKFIFELRPMTLDDLGLAATLRRYTADIAAKYRIEVQVNAPYAEQPLPKWVEVPVFRVAQEAIMNAVEHSRATIIQITFAVSLDGLMLIIDDNGTGFDVEAALSRAMARQTTGIPNMQDRAELLGGWLRIESMRGRGSRVELAIPLDPKR